jgi:hypothetical protein
LPVKVKLSGGSFRAYLFDCDYTSAYSMPESAELQLRVPGKV